jgi:predicted MPP superfamily phosphohydrolase
MHSDTAVRWLHISDFHLNGRESYERDRVLNALIKSIPNLISRVGKPDMVLVTGDIANSGKPEQYAQATSLLDNLLDAIDLDRSRIFVVPGNHDVDRDFSLGLVRTLTDNSESDAYFNGIYAIPHVSSKQSAFKLWHDEYFKGARVFSDLSTCSLSNEIVIREQNVSVLSINTAAFCVNDEDSGKLMVGRRCIDAAVTDMQQRKGLKIALMHHPLSWLSQIEVGTVKATLRSSVDIILNGHLHETDIEEIAGLAGEAIHLAAGATYQTEKWPNRAMFGEVCADVLKITPICYAPSPVPVWTVDTSIFPSESDYSRSYSLGSTSLRAPFVTENKTDDHVIDKIDDGNIERLNWQDQLFVSPSKVTMYAEPRIKTQAQNSADAIGGDFEDIDVNFISQSDSSFIIDCRPEHGGTNLLLRLAYEIAKNGNSYILSNARELPNYRKKLAVNFKEPLASPGTFTLLIDDFDLERDDRLIREIHFLKCFKRIIAINSDRGLSVRSVSDLSSLPFDFSRTFLWSLSRDGIRELAVGMFESQNNEFISRVVGKIYNDLLGLCIPLSPSNVMMYLNILFREGEFSPINRVDILNRYVSESLRRPSDSYSGTFNYKNKMDLLSSFCSKLHANSNSYFTDREWYNFCVEYQSDTLAEFDAKFEFEELESSRIFYRFGGNIYFRYSFFYEFFLGRYLVSHTHEMRLFLENREYMKLMSVVDVITGLGSNNIEIVEILLADLNRHLGEFSERYVAQDFDPLLDLVWPDSNDEDEKLWQPIEMAIAEGPYCTSDIDKLKSSLISEARTVDQQVIFHDFSELEYSIFAVSNILSDALKNSDDIPAALKLSAYDGLLRCERVAFQVGTMFAKELSTQRFFAWGGALFVDFNKNTNDHSPSEVIGRVVRNLAGAVSTKLANDIATNNLAGVFRARAASSNNTNLLDLINFHCIINARGKGWADTAQSVIERTGKNAYYLHELLTALMVMLKRDALQPRDSDAAKRLVALIQTKRGRNKMLPGAKAVTRTLRYMEKDNQFSDKSDTSIR